MVKDHFKKQFWISFGIIIASVAIAVGALHFFSGAIATEAASIANDRAQIQEKTDAVSDLADLLAAAPQADRYQVAIDQVVPDQYQSVTFTQWVASVGSRYSVTANALFQGTPVPAAGTVPGTAQFSLNAQGAPNNLVRFLGAMNTSSSGYFVTLDSFDLTFDGTNDNMTAQGTLIFR